MNYCDHFPLEGQIARLTDSVAAGTYDHLIEFKYFLYFFEDYGIKQL